MIGAVQERFALTGHFGRAGTGHCMAVLGAARFPLLALAESLA